MGEPRRECHVTLNLAVLAALGWNRGDERYHWAGPGRGSRFLAGTSWLPAAWNQPYVEGRTAEDCYNGTVESYVGRPTVANPFAVHFMGMTPDARRRHMTRVAASLPPDSVHVVGERVGYRPRAVQVSGRARPGWSGLPSDREGALDTDVPLPDASVRQRVSGLEPQIADCCAAVRQVRFPHWQSKTGNVLFALEASRRCADDGVIVKASCPVASGPTCDATGPHHLASMRAS